MTETEPFLHLRANISNSLSRFPLTHFNPARGCLLISKALEVSIDREVVLNHRVRGQGKINPRLFLAAGPAIIPDKYNDRQWIELYLTIFDGRGNNLCIKCKSLRGPRGAESGDGSSEKGTHIEAKPK